MSEVIKASVELLKDLLKRTNNSKHSAREEYNTLKAKYEGKWDALSEQASIIEGKIANLEAQLPKSNESI